MVLVATLNLKGKSQERVLRPRVSTDSATYDKVGVLNTNHFLFEPLPPGSSAHRKKAAEMQAQHLIRENTFWVYTTEQIDGAFTSVKQQIAALDEKRLHNEASLQTLWLNVNSDKYFDHTKKTGKGGGSNLGLTERFKTHDVQIKKNSDDLKKMIESLAGVTEPEIETVFGKMLQEVINKKVEEEVAKRMAKMKDEIMKEIMESMRDTPSN